MCIDSYVLYGTASSAKKLAAALKKWKFIFARLVLKKKQRENMTTRYEKSRLSLDQRMDYASTKKTFFEAVAVTVTQ